MTTKSPPKQDPPSVDPTRMAYEAHTLAQMLYGRLAHGQPWTAAAFPPAMHEPVANHPFGAPPPHAAWGPWARRGGWGR